MRRPCVWFGLHAGVAADYTGAVERRLLSNPEVRMRMGRALTIVGLLAVAACSMSETDRLIDRETTGDVLLESYSIDQTWGYKLSGMYINADGTVWEYEQTGTPWYPEKLKPGELYERDMLTKHKNARQIGTVDVTLLDDIAKMIKPAARGKMTRAHGSSWGDGSYEVAYLFDPDASTYREIILAGQGAQPASNSAPEARLLLQYLRDVQKVMEAPAP